MAQSAPAHEMGMRRATRHCTDHHVTAESKIHGDSNMHIVRISAHGFMIDDNVTFEQGDCIEMRLPTVGRIEAFVVWTIDKRAGFQFERVIRLPDFLSLLDQISQKLH